MYMKAKYVDFPRLNDLMDTAIRDAEIKAFWMGLSYTDQPYKSKLNIIKKHYAVSLKLIESIIARGPNEKTNIDNV